MMALRFSVRGPMKRCSMDHNKINYAKLDWC
jgi:hypothetical protein